MREVVVRFPSRISPDHYSNPGCFPNTGNTACVTCIRSMYLSAVVDWWFDHHSLFREIKILGGCSHETNARAKSQCHFSTMSDFSPSKSAISAIGSDTQMLVLLKAIALNQTFCAVSERARSPSWLGLIWKWTAVFDHDHSWFSVEAVIMMVPVIRCWWWWRRLRHRLHCAIDSWWWGGRLWLRDEKLCN